MNEENAPGTTPPSDPTAPPPPPPTGETTGDERTMAMLCHLLVIFTFFLGPLIIWLIKKDQSRFVDDQGKESLNWVITLAIFWVGLVVIQFVPVIGQLVGCVVAPIVLIVGLVFGIMGAVAANKGNAYRYPIAIRLLS